MNLNINRQELGNHINNDRMNNISDSGRYRLLALVATLVEYFWILSNIFGSRLVFGALDGAPCLANAYTQTE